MTISFAKCSVMLILTALALGAFLPAARPQTAGFPPELFSRAERTNYQETSQHKDILEFVDTAWICLSP